MLYARGECADCTGPGRGAALHRIHHADLPDDAAAPGAVLTITGEEAHHAARVKRAGAGDALQVLDGRGAVADGIVTEVIKDRRSGEWSLLVRVTALRREPPVRPRLEVWASPPKAARLEAMIDGLIQAGAAAWAPLHTQRTIVEPREGKLDRMHRLAAEASKQCGRVWHLEILAAGDVKSVMAGAGGAAVIADASGGPYQAAGEEVIRLLVGPEGGWTPEELSAARAGGARVAAFGPHIMRIETAAVVAAGIVLDQELRFRGGGRAP